MIKQIRGVDHSGEKKGSVTILYPIRRTPKKIFYWCRCDCGREFEKRYIDISKNGICGFECRLWDKVKSKTNNHNWRGYGELSGAMYNHYKQGCKRKSRILDFNITIQDMWDKFIKQKRKCALTGLELKFSKLGYKDSWKEHTASLDRIDSTKGYTKDNIQWVHKIIQKMKQNLSIDVFKKFCSLVAKAKNV